MEHGFTEPERDRMPKAREFKGGTSAMKKGLFFPFLIAISFFLFCCGQEQKKEGDVLAKINDYELTLLEFEYQLVEELEMDKDFKLTKEAKKEFLDQLIRKEILIQEAKKLKMDRRQKFIRTIERYWESTLIRDLMELKGKEISKRTSVSEEEIRARYEKMKASEPDLPPFEDMKQKISAKIGEDKKRARLIAWINGLKKNAKIEIDEQLLYRD